MNIHRFIFTLLYILIMLPLHAAGTDEPIFSFRTHRYDIMGQENQLSFTVMPRQDVGSTTIDVDFGYGRETYTIAYDSYVSEDDSTETLIGGSVITGTISAEGLVRVYGNASDIDYLDIHGSEVYDLDISQLSRLMILALPHNDIQRLDVSMLRELQYLDLKDNPFNEGLTIGEDHPWLYYLNINRLGDNALATGTVQLSNFKALQFFTAWDTKCLTSLDVSQNTNLRQISIDNSGVTRLDVSNNPNLLILNVSDCGFTHLDVSHNPYLVELYVDNEGQAEASRKLSTLDVSQNAHLQRIFCNGNRLTTLDISHQNNLVSLYASNNYLTELVGLDQIDSLAYLDLSVNCFDFATFPDVDPMTYFYYVLQRDMKVADEYQAGTVLDLSARVCRPGSITQCVLARIPSSGIEDPVLLTEGIDYSYADGKIELLQPQPERVAAYFINSLFPDVTLHTSEFWIRSAEEYGQPVPQFSFIPSANAGGSATHVNFTVGVERDPERPVEQLLVNFGYGELIPYTLTDGDTFHISGYATGAVTVSGRIEMPITSLTLCHTQLESIDLSQAKYLQSLDLSDDALTTVDLSWNNLLHELYLNDNQLDGLVLTGVNEAHHKNVLTHIEARGNHLINFEDVVGITIEHLDLSDNELSHIEFKEYENLCYLNLSNNRLTALNLDDCTSLSELHVEGNAFRLSTLPLLDIPSYSYTPQQPLTIASRSMTVSLASETLVNGLATTFVWKEQATGAELTEGVDYTFNGSKFVFLEPAVGKDVYCVLTNATFPAFDEANPFCTTTVHVMGKPNYTVATFTTPEGEQTGSLSLAGKNPNTYIYIDWGNEDMIEYNLQTQYTLFEAQTIEGAEVKVYSYEAADGDLHVFSIDGVTMSNIDVSRMPNLFCLSLCGAGLEAIDLSSNTGLAELNLEGNALTDIDLSHNPNLFYLVLAKNKLSTIDLSHQSGLSWLVLSDNELSSFDGSNLQQLYSLSLTRNHLTELDLSPLSGLRQLSIAENQLSSIDLSQHPYMEIVDLSGNCFTLATLPVPTSNYMIYNYGQQAPVDVECLNGKVDLSSMSEIAGVASQYYWFEGELQFYYDADGNLQLANHELTEGTDFVISQGVTTFAHEHTAVTGYIQNELFPNIILLTRAIAITLPSAIEEVNADSTSTLFYNLFGQHTNQEQGLIIRDGKISFSK